jgi:hypothetical protein
MSSIAIQETRATADTPSTTTPSARPFWKILINTIKALSSEATTWLWKLLSGPLGKPLFTRPLEFVRLVRDTRKNPEPKNEEPSHSHDQETVSPKKKEDGVAPTKLFPFNAIESLSSTTPGYPVACATDSTFDIMQVRNTNGVVVGWDFGDVSQPFWDNNSQIFEEQQQFSQVEYRVPHASKFVMRRNRPSNVVYPYSVPQMTAGHHHSFQQFDREEVNAYNKPQPQLHQELYSEMYPNNNNGIGETAQYYTPEYTPPEYSEDQDAVLSYAMQSSSASESPEIFPAMDSLPFEHGPALQPTMAIPSISAPGTTMANGVYPLVHSRANSDNGSPEHIPSFIDDKTIEHDLAWSGLNYHDYMAPNVVSPQSSIMSTGSTADLAVSPDSSTSTPSSLVSSVQFVCPECNACFRIKGYLTRHMKKHADKKAYTCPFYNPMSDSPCHPTGGFSRRDTYKTHLKARHFVYPPGTKSEKRGKVGGSCSGGGIRYESNETWVEEHIQKNLCKGIARAY